MVEQTTAATELLAKEAEDLYRAFSAFQVDTGSARRPSAPVVHAMPVQHRAPAPRPAARPAPQPQVIGNLAVQGDDDWSEF
jgi:methyl-accepting chemotaxis protein